MEKELKLIKNRESHRQDLIYHTSATKDSN